MSKSVSYHHWVEWSDEDNAFIGYCPDLFMGGACHGSDEAKVYARLVTVIRDEIKDLKANKKPMPPATVRPMRELVTG
jgi:hypothetical protein